jgi:hypothetical protein
MPSGGAEPLRWVDTYIVVTNVKSNIIATILVVTGTVQDAKTLKKNNGLKPGSSSLSNAIIIISSSLCLIS